MTEKTKIQPKLNNQLYMICYEIQTQFEHIIKLQKRVNQTWQQKQELIRKKYRLYKKIVKNIKLIANIKKKMEKLKSVTQLQRKFFQMVQKICAHCRFMSNKLIMLLNQGSLSFETKQEQNPQMQENRINNYFNNYEYLSDSKCTERYLNCKKQIHASQNLQKYDSYNNFLVESYSNLTCQKMTEMCLGLLNRGGGYLIIGKQINHNKNRILSGFSKEQINQNLPKIKNQKNFIRESIQCTKYSIENGLIFLKQNQVQQKRYVILISVTCQKSPEFIIYYKKRRQNSKITTAIFRKSSYLLCKVTSEPYEKYLQKFENIDPKRKYSTLCQLLRSSKNRVIHSYYFTQQCSYIKQFQIDLIQMKIKNELKQQTDISVQKTLSEIGQKIYGNACMYSKTYKNAVIYKKNNQYDMNFIQNKFAIKGHKILKLVQNQEFYVILHNLSNQVIQSLNRDMIDKFYSSELLLTPVTYKIGLRKSINKRVIDTFMEKLKPWFKVTPLVEYEYQTYDKNKKQKVLQNVRLYTPIKKIQITQQILLCLAYYYFNKEGYRPQFCCMANKYYT